MVADPIRLYGIELPSRLSKKVNIMISCNDLLEPKLNEGYQNYAYSFVILFIYFLQIQRIIESALHIALTEYV